MKLEVILVSTGCYQEYIEKNIEQLLKFDFNISVIVDKKFFDCEKVMSRSSL